MAASAAIIVALGAIHLVYTFTGTKLNPRDSVLHAAMRNVSPVLTRETTMWNAWVGFNASHSMGALMFGLVYGYLALFHGLLLFGSPFLQGVGLTMLVGLAILGRLYWFTVPFRCICLALMLYLAAVAVAAL